MAVADLAHHFVDLEHALWVLGVLLQHQLTNDKDMHQYWVYITRDQVGFLSSHFSIQTVGVIADTSEILYLRPFSIPLDALAHKHLLDGLSGETIQYLIYKYREETNLYVQSLK